MRARLIVVLVAVVGLMTTGAYAQTFAAWTLVQNDGTDLSVVAPGLHSTSYKMQVLANDTNPIYAQDDSPADEARYRARFYLNANSSDPGSGVGNYRQRILTGIDTTPSNVRLIEISFRYNPSVTPNWGVLARFKRPDLGPTTVSIVGPVAFDPTIDNYIEIDWQRETTVGAANGSCHLWLNGVEVGTGVTGVGLGTYGIDTARLGALTPKVAASAVYFLDEFESRRQTYIGALP